MSRSDIFEIKLSAWKFMSEESTFLAPPDEGNILVGLSFIPAEGRD